MKMYLTVSVLGILFLPSTCWTLSLLHYVFSSDLAYLTLAKAYTYWYFTNPAGIFICWIIFGNICYLLLKSFELSFKI